MRIETDITLDDYRAFIRYARRFAQSGSQQARRSGVSWKFIAGPVAVAAVLVFIERVADFSIHWPSAYIPFVIFFALFFSFLRRQARQAQIRLEPTPGGCLLGHHTLDFSADGVVVESEHFRIHLMWTGVQSLEDVGDHLFLLVDTCTGCIIPKRSLPGSQEEDELKALVAAHMRATGSGA